jgi:CelD/BcsL family acetyltransferase involved in cellulose biosynthesis
MMHSVDLLASRAGARVSLHRGYPATLDAFAASGASSHGFLRAAWFGVAQEGASTLVATRSDGSFLIAVPTASVGPTVVGARAVPGSYWPFRSPLVARDAAPDELATALSDRGLRMALSPLWRVGPVYADDPGVGALRRGARLAGWSVLSRPLGRTFTLDLSRGGGRGRGRRLDGYARRLGEHGPVRFEHVSGADWSPATLDALAAVERASWIGRRTDGSGAKFLTAAQRAYWRHVLSDRMLARALSATILHVGAEPAAFSFDLIDGETQYAIASAYDERFAACRPGHLVTRDQLARAAEAGVRRVDLGAGDSGYKRAMGAEPGSEIVDLLFVRRRSAAALLSLRWGGSPVYDGDAFAAEVPASLWERWREPLMATGALAAASAMLALGE